MTERAAQRQWSFENEINRYCASDVFVLAAAMTRFEKEFEDMTNVCIFGETCSAAGAAMKTFRRGYLLEHSRIALDKYGPGRVNFSIASQKFLKWKQLQEDETIEMATTVGEKKLGRYKVDGYINVCFKYPRGKVIEFNGCFWHYHECRWGATQKARTHESVAQFRAREKERISKLAETCEVEVFYECEVQKMLDENPEMQKFFDECEINVRII